jgi:hypothetical protein
LARPWGHKRLSRSRRYFSRGAACPRVTALGPGRACPLRTGTRLTQAELAWNDPALAIEPATVTPSPGTSSSVRDPIVATARSRLPHRSRPPVAFADHAAVHHESPHCRLRQWVISDEQPGSFLTSVEGDVLLEAQAGDVDAVMPRQTSDRGRPGERSGLCSASRSGVVVPCGTRARSAGSVGSCRRWRFSRPRSRRSAGGTSTVSRRTCACHCRRSTRRRATGRLARR